MVPYRCLLALVMPPFQYSLCRVVLMVEELGKLQRLKILVSVLALSSRFDGPSGNANDS